MKEFVKSKQLNVFVFVFIEFAGFTKCVFHFEICPARVQLSFPSGAGDLNTVRSG